MSLGVDIYSVFNMPPYIQYKTEERLNKMPDNINHPSHYTQGGIECIDAIKAALTGLSGIEAFYTGCIIKYMWRWKHKNGVEDLKKAREYLDWLIDEVEK